MSSSRIAGAVIAVVTATACGHAPTPPPSTPEYGDEPVYVTQGDEPSEEAPSEAAPPAASGTAAAEAQVCDVVDRLAAHWHDRAVVEAVTLAGATIEVADRGTTWRAHFPAGTDLRPLEAALRDCEIMDDAFMSDPAEYIINEHDDGRTHIDSTRIYVDHEHADLDLFYEP